MPAFPNARTAGISLTYDDGAHELLDHAIPDLNAAGFRGTFYIQTGPSCLTWPTRCDDWKRAAEQGHEIGNHTIHHPCSGKHSWVKTPLESYTLETIEQELLDANREIEARVGVAPSTFAYTCGEDFVTPARVSFRPVVERLFLAARGGGGATSVAVPGSIDFSFVPSFAVQENTTGDQLCAYVDHALASGAWGVFMFHGIGGGHRMNVSRQAHQQLLAHLQSHAAQIHTDTFTAIATHLRDA